MATLKHLSSKNADYGVAEQYLTFEHDEFTGKPILDENGRLVPRQDYRISSLNCGEEDFAVACMRANLRYGKNQQREDVKSHHYILSFDPRDGPDHGLTMDKAQALGERFCAEQFPGHQALVCTHPDGHNHSGNIHVHIVINSLRVAEVERKPYMDRASDTQAGAKHRCTAAAMRHFRAEVMELCQGAGLYQIDLLGGSKNRVTEREYWAQKKGQLALDTEAAAQGKPPTKFETDKEKLRREIRAVLNLAVSFEDFAQRLLQRGITVKESRGRLSYLTPDRAKPITARKLGDDFDRAAVGAALERNAARPSLGAKPSIREQLRQPQGVQRMVDIEAKKAEGKGIGYQQWASVFNLKQIANSVNVYTEYGFSSPEELDAAVSAAFAAVRDSAASLKPKELALKEEPQVGAVSRQKPLFALKTNLLYDVASLVNLGLEVPLGNRFSLCAEAVFPWWKIRDKDITVQMLEGTLEGRYWLGKRTQKKLLTGFFAGVYAGVGLFDFQLGKLSGGNGVQGNFFVMGGLSAGYAHVVSNNLRMEYSLGLGYLRSDFREYISVKDTKFGDIKALPYPWDVKRISGILPTKLQVSLVWMLSCKKGGGR